MTVLTDTRPPATDADRSGLQVIGLVMAGLTLSGCADRVPLSSTRPSAVGCWLDQNLTPQVGKTFVSRAG